MHLRPGPPASMLTKLLRREKDNEKELRGGTRGGKDQFSWEDVKQMAHKDRECYLGVTAKIGYLDRGAKWRKKDWYLHTKSSDEDERKAKFAKLKEEDEQRLQEAMGLVKRETKKTYTPLTPQAALGVLKKIKMDSGEEEKRAGLGFNTKSATLSHQKFDLSDKYFKV